MRALTAWLFLCLLCFAVPTAAVTYYHERLAVGLGNASGGVMSERGDAAYLAGLPTGSYYDPWIGGHPYATSLLNGDRSSYLFAFDSNGVLLWGLWQSATGSTVHIMYGLDDLSGSVGSTTDGTGAGFDSAGLPVWFDSVAVYRGTSDYSTPILGSGAKLVTSVKTSPTGDVAWSGFGSSTNGSTAVFLESTNLSDMAFSGAKHSASVVAVNGGHVLWQGKLTAGVQDVFLGTANLSAGNLGGDNRAAVGTGVSFSGAALWQGRGPATGGVGDTFLGATNLSMTALGSGTRISAPGAVSDSGSAAWTGASNTAGLGVFLGTTNYSAPVLGTTNSVAVLGITSGNKPVWRGSGASTNSIVNVFAGTTNLTMGAYGFSQNSYTMAMNRIGQVLWLSYEPDGTVTIWLSSPSVFTTLSGSLDLSPLSVQSDHSVTMSFLEPGSGNEMFNLPVTVAADGTYSVDVPQTGLFDVRVTCPHFVSRVVRSVPVIGDCTMSATLPNGDATLDNKVNLKDLSAVLADFGSSAPAGDPVDLDENGSIGLGDISIVLSNYNSVGE